MNIRELSLKEFNEFRNSSPYDNFYQSLNYALVKAENGYEYEIIGLCDGDKIYGAAVVIVGLLDGYIYAYMPRGMIIDYSNAELVQKFTDAIYKYYKKEGIAFIKINPPIKVAQVNYNTGEKEYYMDNYQLIKTLEAAGYTKLLDNIYFESVLPRFNPIVDLDNYKFENLSKNTKNKIRRGIRKGLTFEKGRIDNIHYLEEFVKNKVKRGSFYYNDYYNIFQRDNTIDYFLIGIDHNAYMMNTQEAYAREKENNEIISKRLRQKPGNRNINIKMNSDKTLLAYKNDIALASKHINDEKKYIAGALVIRHGDTATIIISGYDKVFSSFAPNYFLYYSILEYYKGKVKYVDLNGISGDFSKDNKYHGLNRFKLGFKPTVYEYIGEFDLIINERVYNHLYKKGYLNEEFNNEN